VFLVVFLWCAYFLWVRGNNIEMRLQAWKDPEGFRRLRLPENLESRHLKVVRLSALRTGDLYPTVVDPRAIVRPKGLCQNDYEKIH
jgi:hypothetical protein